MTLLEKFKKQYPKQSPFMMEVLAEIAEEHNTLPYALLLPIPINCSEDRASYLQFSKLDGYSWKCAYVYKEYNDSPYPREYIQIATIGKSINDCAVQMLEKLKEKDLIK